MFQNLHNRVLFLYSFITLIGLMLLSYGYDPSKMIVKHGLKVKHNLIIQRYKIGHLNYMRRQYYGSLIKINNNNYCHC